MCRVRALEGVWTLVVWYTGEADITDDLVSADMWYIVDRWYWAGCCVSVCDGAGGVVG